MRVIGRLFLVMKVSGIGAPLRREGRRGVLYTSSSCRAFSAGLIGQRWAIAEQSIVKSDEECGHTYERKYQTWIQCQTERIPVGQVNGFAEKSVSKVHLRQEEQKEKNRIWSSPYAESLIMNQEWLVWSFLQY
jgi:hypothetical protein